MGVDLGVRQDGCSKVLLDWKVRVLLPGVPKQYSRRFYQSFRAGRSGSAPTTTGGRVLAVTSITQPITGT